MPLTANQAEVLRAIDHGDVVGRHHRNHEWRVFRTDIGTIVTETAQQLHTLGYAAPAGDPAPCEGTHRRWFITVTGRLTLAALAATSPERDEAEGVWPL